mgnify:CR=1 FL=1
MSEEEYTQVKISMPLIDDIELQRIDTFYNDIVEEYTKAFVREQEQVIVQRIMKNLQQENSQLKEVIETLKNTNALLIKQKYQLEKDLDNESNKIEKAIEFIYITYQIISEQPSRNIEEDNFILSRLESFIEILKGDKE